MLLWRPTSLSIFRYEPPFRQYPGICGITGRTSITSIHVCRPSLISVVLVSREQLWLCRSRCEIRNSVQIGWNCTYGTENSGFPSAIYTKSHTTPANIPLYNVQTKIRPKPIHVEMRMKRANSVQYPTLYINVFIYQWNTSLTLTDGIYA